MAEKTRHLYGTDADEVRIRPAATNISQILPTNTYVVVEDPKTFELYLKIMNDFDAPKVIYGELENYAKRIIRRFESLDKSTGVLLVGEKGSGKTLLAKLLSRMLKEQGVSTVIVNEAFHPTDLGYLLQGLPDGTMVFYDEFDKIWRKELTSGGTVIEDKSNQLLGILDGNFSCRLLHVLTANAPELNPLFINRPGRALFNIIFTSLSAVQIEEYIDANLKKKEHKDGLLNFLAAFSNVNFDMLSSVVKEMNFFGEDIASIAPILNLKLTNEKYEVWRMKLVVDGKVVNDKLIYSRKDSLTITPFRSEWVVSLNVDKGKYYHLTHAKLDASLSDFSKKIFAFHVDDNTVLYLY